MKLAVIVGHTKNAPGAVSFKGETEYSWNGKVAHAMKEYAALKEGIDVEVYTRDAAGVSGAAKLAKEWGADASIELHFNAATGIALGCECLILRGDVESARHADQLTDQIAKKYGIKERRTTQILPSSFDGDGVFETTSANNGYGNLNAVKAAGIPIRLLIEPAFLNTANPESLKIYDDIPGYAKLIVDHFAEGLKPEVKPQPDVEAQAILAKMRALIEELSTKLKLS